MKPFAIGALALLVLLAALPADAGTFVSRRGARVFALADGVFEVVPGARNSGPDFWCAAGDYAQRALRAPWTARVSIVRGRAPSVATGRRSSVQFTLDPGAASTAANGGSLSINALRPGDTMSVQAAFDYCYMPPSRF